jgi:hypothetical protein
VGGSLTLKRIDGVVRPNGSELNLDLKFEISETGAGKLGIERLKNLASVLVRFDLFKHFS